MFENLTKAASDAAQSAQSAASSAANAAQNVAQNAITLLNDLLFINRCICDALSMSDI